MSDEIVEVYNGITRQLIDNDTIAVIISDDAARDKVDAWSKTILELVANWERDKPYLAVYDVSKSSLTPYTRKKSEEVAQESLRLLGKNVEAAYALVLPKTVLGNIMRLFAQRDLARRYPMWQIGVFTEREKALAWIRSVRADLTRRHQENSVEKSRPQVGFHYLFPAIQYRVSGRFRPFRFA
jgi:hypothetical protein